MLPRYLYLLKIIQFGLCLPVVISILDVGLWEHLHDPFIASEPLFHIHCSGHFPQLLRYICEGRSLSWITGPTAFHQRLPLRVTPRRDLRAQGIIYNAPQKKRHCNQIKFCDIITSLLGNIFMTKIQKLNINPLSVVDLYFMTQHNVGQIHSYQLVIGLPKVTMQREKKVMLSQENPKRKNRF